MINYREKLFPGKFYHVFNHAVGKERLFRNDENYNFFLKKYHLYISPVADTYAYCLMPNHFHFLIKFKTFDELTNLSESLTKKLSDSSKLSDSYIKEHSKILSNAFKNFFSSYAEAYNKIYKRKGSLFEPRFRRISINKREYFINVLNYIHQNPVYHEFVKEPDDWKFSSYSSFFTEKNTLLKKNTIEAYFKDNKNYTDIHNINKAKKFAIDMELSY